MNGFLTNLLKEKFGITDIANVNFKPLDDDLCPEDLYGKNASKGNQTGRGLTPAEVNAERKRILKLNFS